MSPMIGSFGGGTTRGFGLLGRIPFTAIGGTIVQANGYQHHIFTSSGTFSVNAPRSLTILVQDGGQSGGGGFRFTFTGRPIPQPAVAGGSGGASGQARYISASNFSGSITVTVGGGGGSSGLSTGWGAFSTRTSNGGGGAFTSTFDAGNSALGENGRLNTEIASFWSNVPNMEARSGGGGGGGGVSASPSGTGRTPAASSNGEGFRGSGGQGQTVGTDGAWNINSASGPFGGNAGYVVISYLIS